MAVVSAFPRIARAQVDPVTYLQAAAAAVSIISNILGLSDNDAELEKKLDVISSKLDLIIANQRAIIDEIRALRIHIDEAFYQSWVDEYSRDIEAFRKLHRIYATRPVNAGARTALETIALQCSHTTLKIGKANFLVFPTYLIGIGVVLGIHKLLRTPRQIVAAARKEFVTALNVWLDKDSIGSIVSTIARFGQESTARRDALEAKPKQFDASESWKGEGGIRSHCYHRYVTRVSVAGTFDTGYSAGGSTVVKTGEVKDCEFFDPCSPASCPPPLTEAEKGSVTTRTSAALRRQLATLLRADRDPMTLFSAPQGQIVVPPFVPSGYAYIDELNRERVAIFELLLKISQLQVLQEEMEKARKELQRP